MQRKYRFILAGLTVVVVYELFLILLYLYRDVEINGYMARLSQENEKLSVQIDTSKATLGSIRTNAYADRVAKTSQNKKNPKEEVIFLVSKDEFDTYRHPSTLDDVVRNTRTPSPTAGMTNPEKWAYYLFDIN